MKSLSCLWREAAVELAAWCHTSATQDVKTVLRRIEDEGVSFLTITLPAFGKAFERGLEQGKVDSDAFLGFKTRRGLPVFMSGFLSQVFDVDSGTLSANPSVDCIFAVRFLTNLYAKIELPCSNARVARAMWGYVECEQEVKDWEVTATQDQLDRFRAAASLLYDDVFAEVDLSVYHGVIEPRHGPGATADGFLGNQKYRHESWTTRLESIFPYGEFVFPVWSEFESLDEVVFLEPGHERPVKVVHVPKTLRSPRIIAEEPTCMQYMQQGLLRKMVSELENPRRLSSSFLGFTDQFPNQELARVGSLQGHLATLDLKEASDRVPYLLVRSLFSRWKWLDAAFDATRSTRAEIPDIGVSIPDLRKFASMGSATCFPVEAMVFLTIVFMGIAESAGVPLSRSFIQKHRGKVRVYGDDLIVPVDSVSCVISNLEAFGLRVNRDKSFWNGKFRESCGGDFYDGQNVTPVRLKKEFPSSRKDGSRVAAVVGFRNQLYWLGMWNTAKWLDETVIRPVLKGRFPIGESTSPGLVRESVLWYIPERIHDNTHAPVVKAWVLRPVIPKNSIDGWPALIKCLSSSEMIEDPKHLERSGRPSTVDTKLRWVTPF